MKNISTLLTTLLLLSVSSTAAFADGLPPPSGAGELPRIAVYVTGGLSDNDRKALGTQMLAAIIKSGRYRGIERSEAFLAKVDEEHLAQRSGAIDDNQISELGRQFGVRFICVADITASLGGFQVSARIIDIETAEVVHIAETSAQLKSLKDLSAVSEKIVRMMFDLPDPRKKWLSVGAGGFFASDFGGGIVWPDAGEQIAMPASGGGAYLFFDMTYAEVAAGFSMGGGKWESDNVSDKNLLLDATRISLNFGLFGKYPIDIGRINIFPLAGAEYEYAATAKFTRPDGSEVKLDGKNGRPESAGDMSALWVKAGAGADVNIGNIMYLRGAVLYGMRMPNKFEENIVDINKNSNAEARTGHGITIKIGMGVRL